MASVAVEATGAGLRLGNPQPLFEMADAEPPVHLGPFFPYAVTPDGKRFLIARPLGTDTENPAEAPLTVVLNWQEELKRLAPTTR